MRWLLRGMIIFVAALMAASAEPGAVAHADIQTGSHTKDLAFVFLHGMGGNPGTLQGLSDNIFDKLPGYVTDYGQTHPGVSVAYEEESLNRQYPNYTDLDTWAKNVAESIRKYFPYNNIILVGHSMGGKVALYLTSHDIDGLASRIAAVVTVNSPVQHLAEYYATGGSDAWQVATMITEDEGVLDSLKDYDSSADGLWVAQNKRWLAFVSAEPSPTSPDFDRNGVDLEPRDMDDGIVPISAQYAEGADVVYYGVHAHSSVGSEPAVAETLATTILDYVFGRDVAFSVLADSGTASYDAGLMPSTYKWQEVAGEVPLLRGELTYRNDSLFRWRSQEYVVGDAVLDGRRSRFRVSDRSLWLVSGVSKTAWVSGTEADGRLVIRVFAAPKSAVRVSWEITGYQPKPVERDRYEVRQYGGTPFTGVADVKWADTDSDDFRLQITSHAQGPVRWLKLDWKTYYKQTSSGYVIDGLPFADEATTP